MTYIETNSTEKIIKSLREELDRASKDKARFNTVFDEDDTFIAPPHPSLKRTGTSKAPVKIELISDEEKEKIRQEALAIYEKMSAELDVYEEPKWSKPNSWSYYSANELSRGDGLLIDGVVYVYLAKLAWWRNKTANILIAQHHNPDKQRRIGELDFVYGFKGYVMHQQMARLGVDL